jgi:hypothetical protein
MSNMDAWINCHEAFMAAWGFMPEPVDLIFGKLVKSGQFVLDYRGKLNGKIIIGFSDLSDVPGMIAEGYFWEDNVLMDEKPTEEIRREAKRYYETLMRFAEFERRCDMGDPEALTLMQRMKEAVESFYEAFGDPRIGLGGHA